jgi:hypothetical protein
MYIGRDGAKPEVEKFKGACHKHFRTRAQAEAFIEDWKSAVVDVYQKMIRASLDNGNRPPNMRLTVNSLFQESDNTTEEVDEEVTNEMRNLRL